MKLLPAQTSASLINHVHCMDIFDLCERVARAGVRVDMILADLPYGTTACAWDTVIPFAPMWAAFKRIIKPRGAIVLTASQPFTSLLTCSNLEMFRYEWIWRKSKVGEPFNAKHRPMKAHESVLVFSKLPAAPAENVMNYFPQGLRAINKVNKNTKTTRANWGDRPSIKSSYTQLFEGYPNSVIDIDSESSAEHPTQKPVALFSYLIRTYTQPGELVFDPCVGSGTTAIAARAEGRRYIVGDSSSEYVEVARRRLAQPYTPSFLPALEASA